jgi:transposase-like protein
MNIIEIMNRWHNQEAAISHLERVRWSGHPVCPYCGSDKVCVHASKDKALPRWQCETCHRAFSVTVGTIFHHTHLPLQTWFLAIAIMLNAKKNISKAQLSRDLDLPYKTAWSLALRIRIAMQTGPDQNCLFHRIVEMDETYIGGKPRKGNGEINKRGRGTKKMPVVGIVERNGRATVKVFEKSSLSLKGLSEYCKTYVNTDGAIVITDEYPRYNGFKAFTQHAAIDYKKAYAIGNIHTNTIEGFWSLLKRAWYGQHHHYSKKWGIHYITETVYKYNNRNNKNVFGDLIQHMVEVPA